MKKFLLLVISIDLMFIILHVLFKMDILENAGFRIDRDGGFGEIYQYCKAVLSSIVLLALAWRERSGLILFWSALCFYLFIDDWLRLHERVGRHMGIYLANVLTDPYNQGQVLYAVLFTLVIGLAGMHFWRSSTLLARRLSFELLACIGLLGFAAVVIDYLNAMWKPESVDRMAVLLDQFAVILEEGGEHIAISLILWFSMRRFCLTVKNNARL